MIRSERQRKAMFAQMQGNIRQKYQGVSLRHRQQMAGAALAGTALGALKIAKGPVGKFGMQVAKIGILAKAITMPSKLVHFGLKAHKVGKVRRALKRASTIADPHSGFYVTRKGHILNPSLVSIAMKPFGKRMKAIMSQAI
jgi:hypothetical protein